MRKHSLYLLPVLAVVAVVLLGACASIGRPDGGKRDETPPVFVRSNPMPGATGVDRRTLALYFDENVQLEDAFNKVVVSPVQLQAPQVSANGRRVSVQLRDTLIPGTTYTIDFGDAIKDLNEGNVLDGFALDFSTGDSIDSLRISGIVLMASNLEPAQGIIVGAYDNLADSAIHTLPPARIARTNQYGQFTIRNLAPRPYRVYAINDVNRDWHWDRSEDVAWLDTVLTPSVRTIAITDTLYSSTGADSLISRSGWQFLPNDVLLTAFNEDYRAQYLKDYKRPDRRTVFLELGAKPDSLPRISIVDGLHDPGYRGRSFEEWAVPVYSRNNDSITLWFKDSLVMMADSLRLAVQYIKPDSAERPVWKTDTLRFFYREPKRSKKEIAADTLPRAYDVLNITVPGGNSLDVYRPLSIKVREPLARLDTSAVRLEKKVDTLWVPVPRFELLPDSLDPVFVTQIRQKWEPGEKYRLEIDSAAVENIYGEHNRPFRQEFTVKALEEYANLTFRLKGVTDGAYVELINTADAAVRTEPVVNGAAIFRYLNPGTLYARMFFDDNRDGKWTTGSLDSIQPEEVAYYPKKLDLKRNWDVEQEWDIYETPIDMQKPYALLKNKPKLKRGEVDPRDLTDEEEEDEFMGTGYRSGKNNNSSKKNNRNNNRNNNSFNMNSFRNGL